MKSILKKSSIYKSIIPSPAKTGDVEWTPIPAWMLARMFWNMIDDPLPNVMKMWNQPTSIFGRFNQKRGEKTNATVWVKKWLKTDFILLKGETADSKTEVGECSHAECCCAVSLGWPALKASTSSRRNSAPWLVWNARNLFLFQHVFLTIKDDVAILGFLK